MIFGYPIQVRFYISMIMKILYQMLSLGEAGHTSQLREEKIFFAEFRPNTFSDNKEYQIKIWLYNREQDALNLWFRFIIEEYDEQNNIWYETTFFPEHTEVINENWSLIEGAFKVNNLANSVYIVSKGKEDSKAMLRADDLLIYETGNNVYKIDEMNGELLYNNHQIRLQ